MPTYRGEKVEHTLVLPQVSLPTSSARFGSLVIRKLSKIVPDLTYIEQVYFILIKLKNQININTKTDKGFYSFYLPQVESNHADTVVFVDLGISRVLGVVDLRVDPLAFVGGIVDLSGLPLTLLVPSQRTKAKMTPSFIS